MRLAEYTDYTLRVLMYCAARPHKLVTISELAEHHRVSRNHLMKIVTDLGRQGVLETTRGRGGGLRLLKDPAQLRIGDVVRASETDFRLVECFDPATNECRLNPSCRLKALFKEALKAYFTALDGKTLADMIRLPPQAAFVTPSGSASGSDSGMRSGAATTRGAGTRRRTATAVVASPRSHRKPARKGGTDA